MGKIIKRSGLHLFFYSPLFWVGLAIRLLIMPFFGSHYLKTLFIPFLDEAVLHLGQNPWALKDPHFFPYGSALFAILFIPRLVAYGLFGSSALGLTAFSIALVKLPLLFLDFTLFYFLRRMVPERWRELQWFYWLNPIVLFVTYAYGQLDIATVVFSLIAIFYLANDRITKSALFFALSLLCKFHVAILIPFIVAYLWNREFFETAFKKISLWMVVVLAISLIGFYPVLTAGNLSYASTSSPEALRLFSLRYDFDSGQTLYLGFFMVLAILGRLVISTRISKEGLFFGSGILFLTLILITQPFPGWFLWSLPFVIVFFLTYLNIPKVLFVLWTALYFVYFGLEYVQAPHFLQAIGFSFLQLVTAGIGLCMWKFAVSPGALLWGRAKPVLIGVAGDSGAGKNYLSQTIRDLFTPRQSLVLEGDDYHKWERGHFRWNDYTHLNPRANHLFVMAQHTRDLSRGNVVFQSHYDHDSGQFTEPREIRPTKAVVVQGLHTLYLRGFREIFDLKVFLDPHPLVRLNWKLRRDVEQRGASKEKVLKSLELRKEDSLIHIHPQRQFADWIIEVLPLDDISEKEVLEGRSFKLFVKHTFWNDAPIAEVLEALSALPGFEVKFETFVTGEPKDIDRCVAWIKGYPTVDQVRKIAETLFPSLRQIVRTWVAPHWRDGNDGINQLILLAFLKDRFKKMEGALE